MKKKTRNDWIFLFIKDEKFPVRWTLKGKVPCPTGLIRREINPCPHKGGRGEAPAIFTYVLSKFTGRCRCLHRRKFGNVQLNAVRCRKRLLAFFCLAFLFFFNFFGFPFSFLRDFLNWSLFSVPSRFFPRRRIRLGFLCKIAFLAWESGLNYESRSLKVLVCTYLLFFFFLSVE